MNSSIGCVECPIVNIAFAKPHVSKRSPSSGNLNIHRHALLRCLKGRFLMSRRFARFDHALLVLALAWAPAPALLAQSKKTKPAAAQASEGTPAQRIDEEYTKLIKQYLQDPRVTTELVDHMPASDTVPSPLKFFGRIPGTPGELTYAADIERYYEALAKASPRAKFWKIGTSEEGRDQVALVIADEAT